MLYPLSHLPSLESNSYERTIVKGAGLALPPSLPALACTTTCFCLARYTLVRCMQGGPSLSLHNAAWTLTIYHCELIELLSSGVNAFQILHSGNNRWIHSVPRTILPGQIFWIGENCKEQKRSCHSRFPFSLPLSGFNYLTSFSYSINGSMLDEQFSILLQVIRLSNEISNWRS